MPAAGENFENLRFSSNLEHFSCTHQTIKRRISAWGVRRLRRFKKSAAAAPKICRRRRRSAAACNTDSLIYLSGRFYVGSKFGGFLRIPPLFRPTTISTAIISAAYFRPVHFLVKFLVKCLLLSTFNYWQ